VVEIFPVLGQTAAATEPTDGTLNDPSFGQDDETLGPIGTADDLSDQARHDARQSVTEHRPGIGAVGEQSREEGELSEHRGQDHYPAVAILNIGGRNHSVQQQTQRVDEDMTLLALDQFACVEAMRIDADPPFSALFTLWLSMMQAVGLASHSSCSRHLT